MKDGICITTMKRGEVCLGYSANPVTGEVTVTIRRLDGAITDEVVRAVDTGPINPGDEQFAMHYRIQGGYKA